MGVSNIDRRIRATVVLGNNEELDGELAFQPMNFAPMKLFLVYLGSTASISRLPMDFSFLHTSIYYKYRCHRKNSVL